MISLQRILSTDEQLYRFATQLLAVSFPAEERRDDELQRQVMLHNDYRLCAIVDGSEPVGVVGYWVTPKFVYFENFCVAPSLRNRGVGSAALQLLVRQYCLPLDCNDAPNESLGEQSLLRSFILEAELPEDELTRRRTAFYKRNGMVVNPYPHIQPHYRKDDPDLPLVVLSYKKPLTPAQYADFRAYLDANVDVSAN